MTFLDLDSLTNLQISDMAKAKPVKKIDPKALHNPNLKELHFENNFINFKKGHDVPSGKVIACMSIFYKEQYQLKIEQINLIFFIIISV